MKRSLTILFLSLISVLIKSTISKYISLDLGTPDITLIILVYSGLRYGTVSGQLNGMAAGIMEDFISLSPLGFNSLIRLILGYISGLFHGRLNLDPILFPVLSVTLATVLKRILSYTFLEIFNIDYSGHIFLSSSFGFEILMNALLAPVLFLFIRILLDKLQKERKTL